MKLSKNKIVEKIQNNKFIILFSFLVFNFLCLSAQDGKMLFKENCAACHSIGKGRLVGPDLKDVHTRYEDTTHLLKWIRNAPQMIKEGDAQAVALYNEYNKVMMTDFSFLSEEQIKNILAYIKEESSVPATIVSAPVSASEQTNQTTNKNSGISFSTADYFLVSLITLMLLVIILLASTIKKLTKQLTDVYEYDNRNSF